jgi:hypothetical protein
VQWALGEILLRTEISNGSHRPPPYFEWWYFHFVTEEGVAINVVVHETDIFGQSQAPYLSLSLQLPGRKPRYYRRPLAEACISTGQPYLRVVEGLIEETAQEVRFALTFAGNAAPEGLRFSGKITKLAPPLAIEEGVLYQDPASGRTSHWAVQIPHATFEAILHVDGTARRLRGMAYQDHQWGSVLLQEFASDWVWGHFSNEETAILFFQILTRHGGQIDRVAMVSEGGVFAGTALESAHLDSLFQTGAPNMFSDSVELAFLNGSLGATFDLAPEKLMRSRLDEGVGLDQASYLRWSTKAELRIGRNPQPAYGITEYIRFRPGIDGGVHC